MTRGRRNVNLAIEVAAFVVAVGAIDLAFFRSDLAAWASLLVFAGEVLTGALVWIATSLLLEPARRSLAVAPNEGRRTIAAIVGGSVFFVLLTAAVLLFGWRSMSLVPIIATGFLVWWLVKGLLERTSADRTADATARR